MCVCKKSHCENGTQNFQNNTITSCLRFKRKVNNNNKKTADESHTQNVSKTKIDIVFDGTSHKITNGPGETNKNKIQKIETDEYGKRKRSRKKCASQKNGGHGKIDGFSMSRLITTSTLFVNKRSI